jgi:mammalian cell entry related domain protein
MKNSTNPVMIGLFVLGAAFLFIAGVVFYGADKFFKKTETFVSSFSESVNGLDVGAPLKYKGVAIGKVERIMIGSNSKTIRESSVNVVYSIDIDLFRRKTGSSVSDFDTWLQTQISDGLRAKLNYQSIVTGMLYIELDFLAEPNAKYHLRYVGPNKYIEIPSAKSGLAELAKAVEKTITQISEIDFKSIGKNADSFIQNLNEIAGDPYVHDAPRSLDKLLSNSNALVSHIDSIVTDAEVKAAPQNLNKLLKNADRFVASAENEMKSLSIAGQKTFANMDSVLKNIDTIVAPQSPLRYELAVMIRTLNESLNSISNLTDYLERNPSALLTGKLKNQQND